MRPRSAQLLALALAVAACRAYKTGAPPDACGEMTPGHGVPPQTSAVPYSVTTSSDSVQPGGGVTVTISSGDQPQFKGFFVQARRAKDSDASPALGNFTGIDRLTTKKISCPPGTDNAVTHRNNVGKDLVSLEWQAPADLDEDVVFRVTVVQTQAVFWVVRNSALVRVARGGDRATTTTTTTTTTTMTATATATEERMSSSELTWPGHPATAALMAACLVLWQAAN